MCNSNMSPQERLWTSRIACKSSTKRTGVLSPSSGNRSGRSGVSIRIDGIAVRHIQIPQQHCRVCLPSTGGQFAWRQMWMWCRRCVQRIYRCGNSHQLCVQIGDFERWFRVCSFGVHEIVVPGFICSVSQHRKWFAVCHVRRRMYGHIKHASETFTVGITFRKGRRGE